MRKCFTIVLAAIVLAGCTGAGIGQGPSKPAVVPAGWAADYDYASGIRSYLLQQYNSARLEGATAYVYIYLDADSMCKSRRTLMTSEHYSSALRHARVSMLSYWRLKSVHKKSPELAFDPGTVVGAFVKITKDGDLGPIFHANGFWLGPYDRFKPSYSEPKHPTWEEYVQALQSYFAENAEI